MKKLCKINVDLNILTSCVRQLSNYLVQISDNESLKDNVD